MGQKKLCTDIMQFCNLASLFLEGETFQMWNNASQQVCAYCPFAVVLYLDTVYAIIFVNK